MIEIVFVLRGRRVEPSEVEDVRERAVLEEIQRSIVARVGALRCPEHDESPTLTAKGNRVDSLEFDVAGCCRDLLTKTAACLG